MFKDNLLHILTNYVLQVIGWRDPARKVIFFATDAVFHVAGDGKLAGIVEPNEGVCGMSNNKYTRSLNQVEQRKFSFTYTE